MDNKTENKTNFYPLELGAQGFKQQLTDELTQNILHFWQTKMKDENGGFFGQMTGQNELQKSAARGGILNARILWTFSSAARKCSARAG